jgi:hypothetical protein
LNSRYSVEVTTADIVPRFAADQLGHGIGVNLDEYAIADREQRSPR